MASRADRVVVVAVVAGRRPVRWRRAAAGESAHSSRAPSSRVHVVGSRFGGGLPVRRSGGRAPVRWSSSRLTTSRAPRRATLPHDFDPGSSGGRRSTPRDGALCREPGRLGAARLGRAGARSPGGRGRPVLVDRGGRRVRGPSSSRYRGAASPVRGARWLRPVLLGPERLGRPPSRVVAPVPLREYEGDPDPLRVGLADPPDRLDAPVGRPLAAAPAFGARPRDELLVPDDLDGLAPVPVPVLRRGRDPVAPWPLRAPVPRVPERAEPDEEPERDWRAGPAGLAGRAEAPDRDDWARRSGCEERGGTMRVYKCNT
jgi:hypothetical protein